MEQLLEKMEQFQETLLRIERSMEKVPFSWFRSINEAYAAKKITRQRHETG